MISLSQIQQMDDQIEHTLYINREVKVYRIPPRLGAGGHSSGTWRVDDCIFTGKRTSRVVDGMLRHTNNCCVPFAPLRLLHCSASMIS